MMAIRAPALRTWFFKNLRPIFMTKQRHQLRCPMMPQLWHDRLALMLLLLVAIRVLLLPQRVSPRFVFCLLLLLMLGCFCCFSYVYCLCVAAVVQALASSVVDCRICCFAASVSDAAFVTSADSAAGCVCCFFWCCPCRFFDVVPLRLPLMLSLLLLLFLLLRALLR